MWRLNPGEVTDDTDMALCVARGDWFVAAEELHKASGKTAGNGSLMRTLPVAGGLAGIHIGFQQIPTYLTEKIILKEEILQLADKLYHLRIQGQVK